MTSESEYCHDYVVRRPEQYECEVGVGNVLFQTIDSLHDAASGAFAGAIDALHTPSDASHERLIECKKAASVRGLGQLLLYTYFRKRDRDLVREQFEDISEFETHIYRDTSDTSQTYYAKPAIEEIEQVLVIGEVSSSDALLLSVLADLEIQVEYQARGEWWELDADMFEVELTKDESQSTTAWLEMNSSDSLESTAEEELWEKSRELFGDNRVFKEVPIGSKLYPERSESLRADVVVQAENRWFVIEVKNSTNADARRAFQKAFGQAASYASIFAREWGIAPDRVAPVVIQQPLALTGGIYRTDRYGEDYDAMRQAAFQDISQPMILGPAQKFE